MAFDHDKHDKHDDKHDKDVSIEKELKKDVDIEKDVKVDVDKDVDVDVDKDVNVDVYKDVDVDVDKDVDVDIHKNVDVDVDVDVWKADVKVKADSIIDGDGNDVNDLDSQKLIEVGHDAIVKMDDLSVRQLAIGKSFNGSGNDSQYSVTQSNDLKDNDTLIAPTIAFVGVGGDSYQSAFPFPGHDGSDKPFYEVKAEGGKAEAGDGIDGNSNANQNGADGSISGDALASADGIANVEAFTQNIVMGGNQQANFVTADVVGGDRLEANDIKGMPGGASKGHKDGAHKDGEDGKHDKHGDKDGHDSKDAHEDGHDGGLAIKGDGNDVNDLDAHDLIDVGYDAALFMDDLRLDSVAIGESFNGPGNDMQFDVVQVNDLVDNDFLDGPTVNYAGPVDTTFMDVTAEGGDATAGDGINGNSNANNNGLDGSVSGSTVASADGIANVEAFTQNIVMGANVQVNNVDASVVGGNSTIADNIDFAS